MGERRRAYRVLVGQPEGRKLLGICRHRWEVILKWVFEKWLGGKDWINLAQNSVMSRALVNAV
jgi:hypothetical protein